VPLVVVDRQRDDGESLLARKGRANHRVQPARKENHRFFHGRALRVLLATKEGPLVRRGAAQVIG
jgi:hypothetical protein